MCLGDEVDLIYVQDVVFLDGMTQVCGTIIGQVDFSSLSSPGQFGVSAAGRLVSSRPC